MALLGNAAAGHGGSTDSVRPAAESMPGCDARPEESPLPETTIRTGGYNISLMMTCMWVCGHITDCRMCGLWRVNTPIFGMLGNIGLG